MTDSWTYGGRIGFDPNRHIGLEFSYARAISDASSTNPVAAPLTGSVTLDQFDFNLLFSQPKGNQGSGFFTLGAGWTTISPDIPIPPRSATRSSRGTSAWA